MAKGWMSKDPSEMTARQQRRMQFLEKRGGGRVQGQPTEMPEMTARQQRRQQFLERKQARQDRRVEDWRAQQQQNNLSERFGVPVADFANKPGSQGENPFGSYRRLSDQELFERGYDPRDPNSVSVGPDGQTISTLMGFNNTPLSAEESQRLWQERLNNPRPQFNSGFEYNRALQQNPGSFGMPAGSLAGAFGAPMPQQPTYMDPRFAEANQRQMRGWGARYMNSQYPGATGGFAMPPRPGQG
jgi:hypothetical protein